MQRLQVQNFSRKPSCTLENWSARLCFYRWRQAIHCEITKPSSSLKIILPALNVAGFQNTLDRIETYIGRRESHASLVALVSCRVTCPSDTRPMGATQKAFHASHINGKFNNSTLSWWLKKSTSVGVVCGQTCPNPVRICIAVVDSKQQDSPVCVSPLTKVTNAWATQSASSAQSSSWAVAPAMPWIRQCWMPSRTYPCCNQTLRRQQPGHASMSWGSTGFKVIDLGKANTWDCLLMCDVGYACSEGLGQELGWGHNSPWRPHCFQSSRQAKLRWNCSHCRSPGSLYWVKISVALLLGKAQLCELAFGSQRPACQTINLRHPATIATRVELLSPWMP